MRRIFQDAELAAVARYLSGLRLTEPLPADPRLLARMNAYHLALRLPAGQLPLAFYLSQKFPAHFSAVHVPGSPPPVGTLEFHPVGRRS